MLSVVTEVADISFLQFKTYSTGTVILFFSFFLFLISIVLVIAYRMMVKQKKLEKLAVNEQFTDNCLRYSLDANEIQAIKKAVFKLQDVNNDDIFEMQNTYEKAIHDEIENAIESGIDTTEIELLYSSIRKKLYFNVLPDGVPLTSTRSISLGHPISLIDIKCEAKLIENMETYFVLKYPEDIALLIERDSILRMTFVRLNDGQYTADVKILDHSCGRIKCRHTIALKRHQLRKNVRMRMSGKMKLLLRDGENNRIHIDAKLLDISAGGFCFESAVSIPVKSIVFIDSCNLPVQLSGVKATIIASSQKEKDDALINKYHASYIDIPFEKKEKIVSCLFIKMRESQKK